MSSIDKYVESEARSCNPHVRVVNIGGRIKGYIVTTKVFDIADRYGYLDASESKMIHDGIAAYEESQRLERERRERERAMELERERARLEAERVAAISALRDEVSKVKNELARSYESAKKAYERAVSDVDLSRRLTAIRGFDVSAYGERISALETKMRNAATGIDGEYRSRLEDISGIESGISDSLSTDEAISRTRRLKRIGTEIVGTELPVSDIRRLGEELDKLAETVGRLEAELSRLTAIKGSARVRGMINDAVSYARSSKICSLDDAQRMIEDIRERVRAVVEVAASEAIAENIDEIAVLNGIVSSCEQLREYVVEQNYTATSYRREIVDAASEVIKAYTELREAEYTTCYSERISQVLTMVQEILIGDYTDGATLEQLRAVFDEAAEYKREDSLQADNYADYLNKVAELTDRGYDAALIEDFDPRAYDEQ